MNIHEFQAKQLLREYKVRVPAGEMADTADGARAAAERLGGAKWMVKAQITAGGRGRGNIIGGGGGGTGDGGSGVRAADSLDAVFAAADAMLGKSLATAQTFAAGLPVNMVYVEQALQVERELALSLLLDERRKQLALLLFERGGVGIESESGAHRVSVDTGGGDVANKTELHAAMEKLMLPENLQNELREIIGNIIRLFRDKDARLIEINPLSVCAGKLFALDAKISFDNNALFRQPEICKLEPSHEHGHRLSSMDEFNYIPLDGDIATLAVGAGLAMATLDALRHYGGSGANFLDLPPGAKVNKMVGALEALLANTSAKCLLINVFGGGIMRCDTVADAILLHRHAAESKSANMPMSVRLAGTNAELANRRLRESAPEIYLAKDLGDAARAAVKLSRGGQSTNRLRKIFKLAG